MHFMTVFADAIERCAEKSAPDGTEDDLVARAMELVWMHRRRELSATRQTIARRFQAATGRTFIAEIARGRLSRAKSPLTLKPNLAALGFSSLADGQASDAFHAWDFRWQGPPGWLANNGDSEPPNITIPGRRETFAVANGAVKVNVPKRSFRMLLLEPPR